MSPRATIQKRLIDLCVEVDGMAKACFDHLGLYKSYSELARASDALREAAYHIKHEADTKTLREWERRLRGEGEGGVQ